MLSFPGVAASAVLETNCGTSAFKATRDEPFRVRVRSSRRVVMIILRYGFAGKRLCKLIFGRAENGVDGLAHTARKGGSRGLAFGQEGHKLRLDFGGNSARQMEIKQCGDDAFRSVHSVLRDQPS